MIVIEWCEAAHWEERERFWISRMRSLTRLTNISDGGQAVNAERTEEWRNNISKALKGRVISVETRERLRQANLGKRRTHCKHGHPFTTENTITDKDGWHKCRECQRIDQTKRRRELGIPERSLAEYCERGHPLSGDNLRIMTRSNGRVERICRECVRIRNREAKRRKREGASRG